MNEYIVSQHTYYRVFGALLILTLLTWGVSYIPFSPGWSVVIALTIAICKGSLVVLFFMHVRYSNQRIWVFVGAGIFWLVLLIALTLSDYLTRSYTLLAF